MPDTNQNLTFQQLDFQRLLYVYMPLCGKSCQSDFQRNNNFNQKKKKMSLMNYHDDSVQWIQEKNFYCMTVCEWFYWNTCFLMQITVCGFNYSIRYNMRQMPYTVIYSDCCQTTFTFWPPKKKIEKGINLATGTQVSFFQHKPLHSILCFTLLACIFLSSSIHCCCFCS